MSLKCQICQWDIPETGEPITAEDGSQFDTWECLIAYETGLTTTY